MNIKTSLLLFTTLLMLNACAAKYNLTPSNTPSNFHSYSISQQTINVVFEKTLAPTKNDPTRYIYITQEDLTTDGNVILPAGSRLSTVKYYRDTPHLVIDYVQLPNGKDWTPANGVLSRTSQTAGFATLSHVTVPK